MGGRGNAQGYADKDGDGQRPQRQLQAGGEALDEVVEHCVVSPVGVAEIPVEDAADVTDKLDGQRVVKAPLFSQLFHLLLGGHLAQIGPGRIARHDAGQEKDDDDHQHHRRNRVQQSFYDVLQVHVVRPFLSCQLGYKNRSLACFYPRYG